MFRRAVGPPATDGRFAVTKRITLLPGGLGVEISDRGVILSIVSGGQCEAAGIAKGWLLKSIDDEPWTLELQERKNKIQRPYVANFAQPGDLQLQEQDVVEVAFQTGTVGVDIDYATGVVKAVTEDGQAARAGIKAGWRFLQVDGEPYSAESFAKKTNHHLDRVFLKMPSVISFVKMERIMFKPGYIGAEISQSGCIVSLEKGGQCDVAGVQVGWVLQSVDDEPWSVEALRISSGGEKLFVLTFVRARPASGIAQRSGRKENDVEVSKPLELNVAERDEIINDDDVEVEFAPGPLGLSADWQTGEVTYVAGNGQAFGLGVREGWIIRKIDGLPCKEGLLDGKAKGTAKFRIRFQPHVLEKLPPVPGRRPAATSDDVASQVKVFQVRFQPGALGISAHWGAGQVIEALPLGQAKSQGVRAGWLFKEIEGQPYSKDLLETKMAGVCPYMVTFHEHPANMLLNGITLRQVLLFWHEYGTPPYGQTWQLPERVAKPSPSRWKGAIDKATQTKAVVANILIPETREEQCCYMLSPFMRKSGEVPTRPQTFVSHWWGNSLYDVLRCVVEDATHLTGDELEEMISYMTQAEVKARGNDGVNLSYWICAFSVNLHAGICSTEEFPCGCNVKADYVFTQKSTLDLLLKTMPRGLIVALDQDLVTLTRGWCLFEIGQAAKRHMQINCYVQGGLSGACLQQPLATKLKSVTESTTTRREDLSEILEQVSARTHVKKFDEMISRIVLPRVRKLAFLQSVEHGHVKLVETQLSQGADANAVSTFGEPALVLAAKGPNWRMVDLLVKRKALVNQGRQSDGATPLWLAVTSYNTESAEILLGMRADIDQERTGDGSTALFMAAQLGHIISVELLLNSMREGVEGKVEEPGDAEHRALMTALLHSPRNSPRNDEGSPVSKQQTARISRAARQKQESWNTFLNHGRNTDGATPLLIAAQEGHSAIVQTLITALAAVDMATTTDGQTPLRRAAEVGNFRAAQALVDGCAAVDQGDDGGCTPLHAAALNGHMDITKVLLHAGVSIDETTVGYEATPLFMAAERGHLEIVNALLGEGADARKAIAVSGALGSEWTPLKVAEYHGHSEVVQAMLEPEFNV